MMHGHEKSDPAIVAMKPANKVEQPGVERTAAEPTAAELAEPRAGTKGNAGQQSTCRTQSRVNVSQALERIRKVARERKKERLTALFHHISPDLLEEAFFELKDDAAPGVDRMTWKDYEADLECNLEDCTTGSIGERIGRCRAGGSTYPNRTADNARSRSPLWRTRSSNGQWPRC
jgi:RNA-directed DNA polymerase